MTNWLSVYKDRRQLVILLQGFSSGLPLLLVFATLSTHLAQAGVRRDTIGWFLWVQLPYNFKFLWAPVLDRLAPPIPIGQRRGWAVTLQILLMGAIVAMGAIDPATDIYLLAALGVLVAFLSASQDIVIDAFRIEYLPPESQGAGSAVTQSGYRIAMFTAGAGAIGIASLFGWFWAYAAMAALLVIGMASFLVIAEPEATVKKAARKLSFAETMQDAVINPFRDFMTRPGWLLVLIFIPAYKLGEAMAGAMAKPFYIDIGFSLGEIAAASSAVAFATTILGGFIGGIVVARFGLIRALLLCGIAQSVGNLAYVALDQAGHNSWMLALSAATEDVTGGMAGTALVAFASRLSRPPYTATQYALLASVMALGRSFFTAWGGKLSLELGWTPFFLLTTIITLPALGMLYWIGKSWPKRAGEP